MSLLRTLTQLVKVLGRQKDEFAQNFDSTSQSIAQAVEAGRDAAEQLNRYQEAVRQALG
jgi:ABC-type transporter Mla subunit MlaD